jgi:D-alanyl-lipoteichoic acid acyltransferase DltB (MBOAT superfamily)
MLFNSAEFLVVFFPLTLAGYLLLASRSSRIVTLWLTFASLAFYSYGDIHSLPILLGSIAFNFVTGTLIGHQKGRPIARLLLPLAIGANLALLGYFKYAQFAIDTANQAGFHLADLNVALPIGISFFTFTQIAFLVDASRGLVIDYSPVRYALFVSYFPHLIAGPILHHGEMIPQFRKYAPNFQQVAVGLTVFAIGLFKKLALADSAAIWVKPVFDAPDVTALEAWSGVLAYAFQIYYDFSGYSDMAIGLSFMFGVRLPINFDSPYKATSIIDFWRRWHITLSRFLKDYLYVPLGGNRKGIARRYVNLLATMLIGGLWHGAAWTFVIWGGLHGLYLAINHGWRGLASQLGISDRAWWRSALGWPITFGAVLIAWVFFRADSLDHAVTLIQSMFFQKGLTPPGSIERAQSFLRTPLLLSMQPWFRFSILMIALAAICWGLPNTQQFMGRSTAAIEHNDSEKFVVWRPSVVSAFFTAMLAVSSFVLMSNPSPFLYFRF